MTEGQDLTAQQSERPRVIFSHEFDNIQSQQYIDSLLQYKNVGYAGGKGEDEDRVMQMVGGGTGLARREVFWTAHRLRMPSNSRRWENRNSLN